MRLYFAAPSGKAIDTWQEGVRTPEPGGSGVTVDVYRMFEVV